jgi:hypothetical protein
MGYPVPDEDDSNDDDGAPTEGTVGTLGVAVTGAAEVTTAAGASQGAMSFRAV